MTFRDLIVRKKRYVFLMLCFVMSFYYVFQYNMKRKHIDNMKSCFIPTSTELASNITLFDDILKAEKKPIADRSVFFIESSCVRNGLATLTARQACAIESTARWNTDRDIFVVFPSKVGYSPKLSSPIMHTLLSYRNIHFRRVNIQNFFLSTPAESLLTTDIVFESNFLTETLSDILRFLLLYKFGGIYLDTDTIVQQNLNVLPVDFAGAESDKYIASGVLGFSSDGFGHENAAFIIQDICNEFSPYGWGHNGPDAISRSLKKICNVNKISEMKPTNCRGFNVLPKQILYPVYWKQWQSLFDPSLLNETLRATKDAVVVHFWNKLSSKIPILKEFTNQTIIDGYKETILKSTNIQDPIGETAYGTIAKANCPLVYNSSGIYF